MRPTLLGPAQAARLRATENQYSAASRLGSSARSESPPRNNTSAGTHDKPVRVGQDFVPGGGIEKTPSEFLMRGKIEGRLFRAPA